MNSRLSRRGNRLKIHKKFRQMLFLALIRLSQHLSAPLCAAIAYHYWRRTFRHTTPVRERPLLETAATHTHSFASHSIPVYRWGESGPRVLVTPGWNGRPSQFRRLITRLREDGYQVIGFDPPGHGLASGKQTSLLEIADVIGDISKTYGPFKGFVGHSAGAVAGVIAASRGHELGQLALIAMPNSTRWLLDSYASHLHLKEKTRRYLAKAFIDRHGPQAFERSSPIELVTGIRTPILFIHDEKDNVVPMSHSTDLKALKSDALIHITRGFGHFRIINANPTIVQICEFFNNSLPSAVDNRNRE